MRGMRAPVYEKRHPRTIGKIKHPTLEHGLTSTVFRYPEQIFATPMFPPTALLALLACLTAIVPAAAPAPASAIPTPASYLILSADVSQPWSGIQGTNPEPWNFTIAGQWPGSKPVSCSLAWNAGAANVTDEAQHVVDVTFNNCTDPGVTIDMTRFRVEPWFLWQLTVAATYVLLPFVMCDRHGSLMEILP